MNVGDLPPALDTGSGARFPATPFTVRIGSEALNVTARSGDTFTVRRAQGGTTATAHSVGDVVALAAVVRGVGFRGGQYTDTALQTPLDGAPGTELRGVHVPFSSDVFFPPRTGLVNYFGAYDGSGATDEQLKVTPAQYRSKVRRPDDQHVARLRLEHVQALLQRQHEHLLHAAGRDVS